MKTIFTILSVIISVQAFAQFPPVIIPGSETRRITSSIVTGQEYVLHILLPSGYSSSKKKYPMVYLMDSQWDFPLVTALYGQQYFDGFIPEMIIVGVTWGGIKPHADSLRARDYTPTNEMPLKQSGGANSFLQFMKDELFPFIETNYKADNEKRILMGCSFGGLVTLYAMFTRPELFYGYVAASPAVGWNKEVIYQYEKQFAAKNISKPLRLYMTVGDVEQGRTAYERFADFLTKKNYAGINTRSKVLGNTGHSGTKAETYTRGLQYIFEKQKLKLDAATLNKFIGTYELPNGNNVQIKVENNQLIYSSPNNKYILYADSETDFYSNHEFFNVSFVRDNTGNISGFHLSRYGGTQLATKINTPDK